ncbi:nuclear transport factor 2 family protein [Spirosoma taeanense]|uniref:Nuclear transport factor 2 family protein n=1 Tax=Spirosoma taeanense TaxID=2735870 RepID=A0A6M5YC32_9BACT|nr:nuclear transport factor 2 family protein [Spirosoma taeanense]QJW91667.1 nuclear transport factor 2 family protein [Spirosoma taeanense]
MKFIFFLLVVTLLAATTTFAQQTTDPTQDPTALGNAFFKAMLDEDNSTMGKLLASDFSITSFDGHSVDGDMLLQGIGGGYVVVDNATVSDTRTRQYNNDSAVMTGTWKAKGNVQGQGFDSNVAFSVMSTRQGGTWKIVHVQFTPMR